MRKLALVALTTTLAACAEPAETPPVESPPTVAAAAEVHQAVALTPQQEEGKVTFESVCWTCHGSGGHGDGPARTQDLQPPTFHTQDYATASAGTLLQRFRASLEGADPSHPHMQYVVKLVREESFAAALAYIPALAYPPEIPGSAIHGQEIFQYRCAGCHGIAGRGDGPGAAALVEVKPVDFTADTLVAKADWDAVFAKVRSGGERVHGSTMPPWGTILTDADMWDLVAYLATFQPGLVSKPSWD
ncbi:MAG: c-type cytochrome [Longimicrobiales bacterium]|nr:c-type cytochrome [Longimicrobiales bacterium]